MTVGVISATKRPFRVAEQRSQDVLQTDAAINPGNSGGPLLNIRGEVVGINTAILANSQSEGNIGIGFAIPINVVRDLLPQLRAGQGRPRADRRDRRRRAERAEELLRRPRPEGQRAGALVAQVSKDGPAAKAGVEPGDVITEFNGKPVANRDELIRIVTGTKPGTTVPMKLMRDKKEKTRDRHRRGTGPRGRERRDSRRDAERRARTRAPASACRCGDITPQIARQLRLPAGTTGAVITDVDPGSPADGGGLAQYDVILKVNGATVASAAEASRVLQKIPSGGRAMLLVWKTRQGQQLFLTIKKE